MKQRPTANRFTPLSEAQAFEIFERRRRPHFDDEPDFIRERPSRPVRHRRSQTNYLPQRRPQPRIAQEAQS